MSKPRRLPSRIRKERMFRLGTHAPMKITIAILFASFAGTVSAEESVFRLPLDTAKKIGSPHATQVPGRVIGSADPPFASVAAIEANGDGLQSIETRAGGRLGIVSGSRKPGHQLRIEFFLNEKGESIAVAHETKLPEAPPEPEADKRPWNHRSLCEAASFAIAKGDVELLPALIKAGLSVDLPLDVQTGFTALHHAVIYNQPGAAKLLIDHGADLGVRSKYDSRAIDMAVEEGKSDLDPILAKPAKNDREAGGYPVEMLEELLFVGEREGIQDQVRFVSLNGEDLPKELMEYVMRCWHDALPGSRAEELGRIPAGRPTAYKDRDSGDYGNLVEITLQPKNDGEFTWRIRTASGPFLAGGGAGGGISRQHGYWIKQTDESWDE